MKLTIENKHAMILSVFSIALFLLVNNGNALIIEKSACFSADNNNNYYIFNATFNYTGTNICINIGDYNNTIIDCNFTVNECSGCSGEPKFINLGKGYNLTIKNCIVKGYAHNLFSLISNREWTRNIKYENVINYAGNYDSADFMELITSTVTSKFLVDLQNVTHNGYVGGYNDYVFQSDGGNFTVNAINFTYININNLYRQYNGLTRRFLINFQYWNNIYARNSLDNSNISNVNITINNSKLYTNYNELTNLNGYLRTNLTYYNCSYLSSGSSTYDCSNISNSEIHNPYLINGQKTLYITNQTNFNITNNMNFVLFLEPEIAYINCSESCNNNCSYFYPNMSMICSDNIDSCVNCFDCEDFGFCNNYTCDLNCGASCLTNLDCPNECVFNQTATFSCDVDCSCQPNYQECIKGFCNATCDNDNDCLCVGNKTYIGAYCDLMDCSCVGRGISTCYKDSCNATCENDYDCNNGYFCNQTLCSCEPNIIINLTYGNLTNKICCPDWSLANVNLCLDSQNLYQEYSQIMCDNGICENQTSFRIVNCPYGCVQQATNLGDGCIVPNYQLDFMFILIILFIIIIFTYIWKKR
jgi:hypothetical protein